MADTEHTTTEEVDAPEPIAETPEEETPGAEAEPSQPDYKAIAAEERARADAAEKAAADAAFKLREAKREGTIPESEPEPEADRPLTRAELQRELDARDAANRKKEQEAEALRIARENTTTEDEAQAAFQTWRSRVQPTENLSDDVIFAIRGIHAGKIAGQNQEIRRTQRSAETVSTDAADGHQDPLPGSEVKLSPADATALKASGFVWHGQSRTYRKPLGNGKQFLEYNPTTKAKRVVK